MNQTHFVKKIFEFASHQSVVVIDVFQPNPPKNKMIVFFETDTLRTIHDKIFTLFDVSGGIVHLQISNNETLLVPDSNDSYIRFYQSNIMNLVPCLNSIYDKNCPRTFRALLTASPKQKRSPSSDNDKDIDYYCDFMEFC